MSKCPACGAPSEPGCDRMFECGSLIGGTALKGAFVQLPRCIERVQQRLQGYLPKNVRPVIEILKSIDRRCTKYGIQNALTGDTIVEIRRIIKDVEETAEPTVTS